jgi:hypothetical protein
MLQAEQGFLESLVAFVVATLAPAFSLRASRRGDGGTVVKVCNCRRCRRLLRPTFREAHASIRLVQAA